MWNMVNNLKQVSSYLTLPKAVYTPLDQVDQQIALNDSK